ncbi:MAG: efflux RND transporter periplasmic adaptor subunit, partial [Lentisphaeria bacterium]|nr:efflux RND transporter periplasmic adaptor subunit [Lentisphaeria bacterium]
AVPEKYVSRIRPGMAIRVSGDALGNDEFTGVISAVATRIDPISRSLTVRGIIANPEERLQSGMLLQVVLLFGERDALLIPEKAISNLGERQFVFHVDANNIAHRQEVTTGIRRSGMVEILSGCNPGDQIVTEGIAKVVDGMKVIRQQEK